MSTSKKDKIIVTSLSAVLEAVTADGVFNAHSDVEAQAPSADVEVVLNSYGRRSTKGRKYTQKKGTRNRRPSRQRCAEASFIFQCIQPGSRPTTNTVVWMKAVREFVKGKRADFRANVEKCLHHFINSQTPIRFTSAPTWKAEYLKANVGVSRATWAAVWRFLLDNKFLGWVGYGVQAGFKPKKRQAEGNDGGVYAFSIPVSEEELAQQQREDELTQTISLKGTSVGKVSSAHANSTLKADKANAPHCLTNRGYAALTHRKRGALPEVVRPDVTAKTSKNKREVRESQEHFARTLKFYVPALRKTSDKYLAAVLRKQKFFATGWTVGDVIYALDQERDGYKGTDGVKFVPGWLRYRLDAHRDERGYPKQSNTQRQRTEQAERRAQARKAAEQAEADARVRADNYAVATGAKPAGKGFAAFQAARAALKMSKHNTTK